MAKYLTNGDDHWQGSALAETVYGRGGDDVLYGYAGKDKLYGDAGNDELLGGRDADQLFGGDGYDYLNGGNGNDLLRGGKADDRLDGGSGRDTLWGEDGNDEMLSSDLSADTLWGGKGNDTLYVLNDVVHGGDGNDNLRVAVSNLGGSTTVLTGDQGADDFVAYMSGNGAKDVLEIADFSQSDNKVDVGGGAGYFGWSQSSGVYNYMGGDLQVTQQGNDLICTFNGAEADTLILRDVADWLHLA